MLHLNRRLGERIVIGGEEGPVTIEPGAIQITVMDVRDGRVKVGVSAPSHVGVFREEVWLRIQEEQRADRAAGG